MSRLRQLWDRIPPIVRGLGIIALVAVVVVVLSLEPVVATVGGIVRIAFFLAIAFFLFLLWRERRGDLEAWEERNRRLFYAAIVLAVVAIGMWIGYGLPEPRDALALILVLAGCAFVLFRVWRLEHRY
jgi:small-conductance mechanosensitive channel